MRLGGARSGVESCRRADAARCHNRDAESRPFHLGSGILPDEIGQLPAARFPGRVGSNQQGDHFGVGLLVAGWIRKSLAT